MVAGSGHDSAAKGSAIDLEVAALVQLASVFPYLSLSLPCTLSFIGITMVHRPLAIFYIYSILGHGNT